MARYIDAEQKITVTYYDEEHEEWIQKSETIDDFLLNADEEIPTADVRENVHGKWIVKDESYWRPHYSGDIQVNKAGLYCSECNKRLAKAQKYRNFCPNCGADMRERRDDAQNN